MQDLETQLILTVVAGMTLPYFVAQSFVLLASKAVISSAALSPTTILAGGAALLLAGIGVCVLRVVKLQQELSNRYLGYCGERLVAENLRRLERRGWAVFHDLPMEGRTGPYNIDHVAIGPGGIFAVETKTRRKWTRVPESRNIIEFDGKRLHWPNGSSHHEDIRQTLHQARDLSQWLKTKTGEPIWVNPILVYPEWEIRESGNPSTEIRVTSHRSLSRAIQSEQRHRLTSTQIHRCALAVSRICRTVKV